MAKKAGLIVLAVLILIGNAGAERETFIVCPGCAYPFFPSIQAAVDSAKSDDLILVLEGEYHERVNVDKRLALVGINAVVNAGAGGSALELNADNITLRGFTARNSSSALEASGIRVNSKGNLLEGNSVLNNSYGISVFSDQNILRGNKAMFNTYGFYLRGGNNYMSDNEAGYSSFAAFYVYNSSRNYIGGASAVSNYIGMFLERADNITVNVSSLQGNAEGIRLSESKGSEFSSNIMQNGVGVNSESGYYNTIYNNLFNNGINANDNGINFWNIPKTAGTNIIGGAFLGGNYWSDYEGKDYDGDGFGEEAYIIGGMNADINADYLPLVLSSPAVSFDTGGGGYPSIAGVHRGIIVLNQNLTVHRLYTYPTPGTGGHSEYAAFYQNGTLLASGNWTGYQGDWHNITFNQTFTLEANVPYTYDIRTGSYPQIIHEDDYPILAGIIYSTEFIDANGRSYSGWIPAIRIE